MQLSGRRMTGGGALTICRWGMLAAFVLTSAVPAWSAPVRKKRANAPTDECEKWATRARAGVLAAKSAEINQVVLRFLRDRPECACEIVRAGAFAIPKRDKQVDVAALAALTKVVLETIYADLPAAREDVTCIVLSVIDALAPDGGKPDPRSIVQILASALPAILANDPSLVDALLRELSAQFPDAAAQIAQIGADARSPLNTTFNRNPTRGQTQSVEPNLQPAATASNASE